jgi:hypothetical protein
MTRNGFILCNDKFVKIRDEQGLVNFMASKQKYCEEDLKRAISQRQMMDNSINIPVQLIIRSLPVNVELVELMRERNRAPPAKDGDLMVEHIGRFIHLDQLDERDARYYMGELSRICNEDFHQMASSSQEESMEDELSLSNSHIKLQEIGLTNSNEATGLPNEGFKIG